MTKSNNKLALLGGKPIITIPFSHYQGMGPEEVEKVKDVIDSGVLSGFFGSWSDEFWGGSIVKEFEEQWSKWQGCKYSVFCNSGSSANFLINPLTVNCACSSSRSVLLILCNEIFSMTMNF